jgi:hypothetical protein
MIEQIKTEHGGVHRAFICPWGKEKRAMRLEWASFEIEDARLALTAVF